MIAIGSTVGGQLGGMYGPAAAAGRPVPLPAGVHQQLPPNCEKRRPVAMTYR